MRTASSSEAGTGPAGGSDQAREFVDHTRRFVRAAAVATQVYPGPVGELLHREIHTHLELGYRFLDADALVPRIVDDILEGYGGGTGPPRRRPRATGSSARPTAWYSPGTREAYCFEV